MKKLFNLLIIFLIIYTLVIMGVGYQPFQMAFFSGFQVVLGVTAIFLTALNATWKTEPSVSLIIAVVAYGLLAVINPAHATIGIYFLEVGLVLLIASFATIAGKEFRHNFQNETKSGVIDTENGIYHYQQIQTIIESEFARGFRYGFPIVLVQVSTDQSQVDEKNRSVLERIDQSMVDFLTKYLRTTDILVRMDGLNNFLIICPGIEQNEARMMVERLTRLSNEHKLTGFHSSIASFPKDGHSFDELYEHLHHLS